MTCCYLLPVSSQRLSGPELRDDKTFSQTSIIAIGKEKGRVCYVLGSNPSEADLPSMQASSGRNARFVHALHWSETQAVILTKPPPEENAVATTLGLFMVCAASALYMVCH